MINYGRRFTGVLGYTQAANFQLGDPYLSTLSINTGGGIYHVTRKKFGRAIEEQVEEILEVLPPERQQDTIPDYSALNRLLMDADRRAKYFAQLEDDDETFFMLD